MNYIAHHGILGMKWGVRRYQNLDGTLTPAGQKRYNRDVRENLGKKKDNRIDTSNPDPSRWAKEDINRFKNLVRESNNLVNDMSNLNRMTTAKASPKRADLSKMSDKEMRDRINRELLERQYNQLFSEVENSKINIGKRILNDTLAVAGTVLGVAGSSLGIALAIKELKG